MRETNAALLRLVFAGAAIGAVLLSASLGGSRHPVPRAIEKAHIDAPILVRSISSAPGAKCSSGRESADDLATYGALRDSEAVFPVCINADAAPVRHEKRPREFRRVLALLR